MRMRREGCFVCSLTFELSWHRRWDARPGLAKMYRVPPDRAWWPAVGAQLERGVRLRFAVPHAEYSSQRHKTLGLRASVLLSTHFFGN